MDIKNWLLAAALVTTSACAGWKKDTETALAYAHEAAVIAQKIAEPAFGDACLKRAQECKAADIGKADCTHYHACDSARSVTNTSLKAVHYAILDAKIGIAIGDEESVDVILKRINDLLSKIRLQIAQLGVL